MIFTQVLRLALCVMLLSLAAIPGIAQEATSEPEQRTTYPVTIENCGQEITIAARPERAIVSWGGQAAYMLALGLDDVIIGMYYRFPDEENRLVTPDLREAYLEIPVIGVDGIPPSREVPISLSPDFFYSDNPSDFADGRATVEDFTTIGATVFSSAYGCTNPNLQTLDMMFDEILTLGVIFDAQAEAQALVAEMEAGLQAVEVRVAGREPVGAVLIEGNSEILYAAGNGLVQDVFARAGGNNIFDGASYDAPPSREVFATSNPDVILLWDTNVETLPTSFINEVFLASPAVANQRIVPIRYIGGIGLRVVELTNALAEAFHPEAFADMTPEATTAVAQTEYPVTIENCGRTLTFDAPPDRVLATWQNTAEIMLALGLEDKLVGVYFGQPYAALPEYEGQYDSFSIFPQRQLPSRELIVSAEADFVFSAYPTFDFSAENGLVTAEEFLESGANVYGLTDQCIDNPQTFSLDNLYQDILNIGIIFDVQAEAQALAANMQGRIASVQERVSGREPVDVIMVDRGNGPIGVWGRGYESVLIELAGGRNLFGDADGSYVEVGIEAFATQDPDLLIVYDYEDAEGVPDEAEYAAFLFATFPNMRPSQEQRYALIGAETNTGIRAPLAVERLAQQFHPEAFE